MMAKQVGEITARHAAKMLKVHERTARRWCKTQRFTTARHDRIVNRYYVKKAEVIHVRANGWPETISVQ